MRSATSRHRERRLRNAATDAEKALWYHLRDRRLGGWKFRRQVRIGPYIVDLLCAQRNLIVEVDGGQHLGNADDEVRSRYLQSEGYKVIRFWNDDVLLRVEQVLEAIHATLSAPPSPSVG